jgi:uracil-DNA glycosylase
MANGLCFSQGTGNNKATPPSLMNIISEIEIDVYNEPFNVERLELENIDAWGAKQATQGVLLLNTALTVEESKPASHIELWKPFTEAVMRKLSEKDFIV